MSTHAWEIARRWAATVLAAQDATALGVQVVQEAVGDHVTVTCGGFQLFPVDDVYHAAAVGDEAASLKSSGRHDDGGSAGAEHLCEELLGKVEVVAWTRS